MLIWVAVIVSFDAYFALFGQDIIQKQFYDSSAVVMLLLYARSQPDDGSHVCFM